MSVVGACPILTGRDVSVGWRPCIPQTTIPHIPHTPPSGYSSCGGVPPHHSSAAHRLQRILAQQWGQADTPLPMFLPHNSLSGPAQTGRLTRQNPTMATPGWWRQGVRHLHIKGCLLYHHVPKFVRAGLILLHHTNPLACNCINRNIKCLRGEFLFLGDTMGPLEGVPVIAACPC